MGPSKAGLMWSPSETPVTFCRGLMSKHFPDLVDGANKKACPKFLSTTAISPSQPPRRRGVHTSLSHPTHLTYLPARSCWWFSNVLARAPITTCRRFVSLLLAAKPAGFSLPGRWDSMMTRSAPRSAERHSNSKIPDDVEMHLTSQTNATSVRNLHLLTGQVAKE